MPSLLGSRVHVSMIIATDAIQSGAEIHATLSTVYPIRLTLSQAFEAGTDTFIRPFPHPGYAV